MGSTNHASPTMFQSSDNVGILTNNHSACCEGVSYRSHAEVNLHGYDRSTVQKKKSHISMKKIALHLFVQAA